MLTKVSITGSFLLAAAHAITVLEHDNSKASPVLNLAQTSDGSCCCQANPCMPTCMTSCEPETHPLPPLPPIFQPNVDQIPDPIQNTILNLDVILTHILHKIGSDNPEVPEPNDVEANHEFVQNVVTPIVITLLAEDVVPQLPVCQYPGGEPFYLGDGSAPVNDNATLPDVDDIFSGALQDIISGLVASDLDEHTRAVLEGLDTDQIIQDLMIKDENGEDAVEVIVAQHTTTGHTHEINGELVTNEFETVTGQDEEMEERIDNIVDSLADQANEANAAQQ